MTPRSLLPIRNWQIHLCTERDWHLLVLTPSPSRGLACLAVAAALGEGWKEGVAGVPTAGASTSADFDSPDYSLSHGNPERLRYLSKAPTQSK